MWMDGWTSRHGEAVVALCNFANMPRRLAYIEVNTVRYFLEGLCKYFSVFKTGHPWNKGQLSVVLRTNEQKLAYEKCKLLLPVLSCFVKCGLKIITRRQSSNYSIK